MKCQMSPGHSFLIELEGDFLRTFCVAFSLSASLSNGVFHTDTTIVYNEESTHLFMYFYETDW